MKHLWFNPHPRMGPWTRRAYAKRPIARVTANLRLREDNYSKWYVFEICLCLSDFQTHSSKHSESHYRYHDKTLLPTCTHFNRQRKRFRIPSLIRISPNTKHNIKTCHNKTFTNHWDPWAGPLHNQDLFETGIGRVQETKPQVFTHCISELQHNLPFQYHAENFMAGSHKTFWIKNLDCDLIKILQILRALQKSYFAEPNSFMA